jgi:hypothetical protein
LLANVAYVVVAAMPADHVAAPFVASVFGPLIAVMSVALYLVLASERATLAGQLAAVANVAAGALVTEAADAETAAQRCHLSPQGTGSRNREHLTDNSLR